MKPVASILRLARIGRQRRRLLAEAVFEVSLASAMIALAPFRATVAFGARQLGRVRPAHAETATTIEQVRWSVEAAARRVPWRALCFEQGLALQRMLRRRGVPAQLHYGLGKNDDGAIAAHVWVAADNAVAIGGEAAAGFATVAIFPAH